MAREMEEDEKIDVVSMIEDMDVEDREGISRYVTWGALDPRKRARFQEPTFRTLDRGARAWSNHATFCSMEQNVRNHSLKKQQGHDEALVSKPVHFLVALTILSPTIHFALDDAIVADIQPSVIESVGMTGGVGWLGAASLLDKFRAATRRFLRPKLRR
ncbi:MAG: hypothetical protein M1839_004562 [Geoglossum umbratile]|nr:MAG: hypothetical protein M1839_004562 [Geoglossum umbratile]